MNTNTTRLADLRADVETLAAHGATLPEGWATITQRWTDYVDRTVTPADDLAEAVIDGADPDTLERLTLAALVHAGSNAATTAPLHDHIAGRVHAALWAAYTPHAAATFAEMAKGYSALGKRFTTAVETVDPDTSPRDLLEASAATRAAWAEVEPLAAELDARLELLTTAARLAGITTTPGSVLGLATTTTASTDRRALWAAWENTPRPGVGANTPRPNGATKTPRGGRWTMTLRAGAKLAAPPTPDKHTPCPRLEEIQTAVIATGPRRGGREQVTWDPEAGETFESKRVEQINENRVKRGLKPLDAQQVAKVAPRVTVTL